MRFFYSFASVIMLHKLYYIFSSSVSIFPLPRNFALLCSKASLIFFISFRRMSFFNVLRRKFSLNSSRLLVHSSCIERVHYFRLWLSLSVGDARERTWDERLQLTGRKDARTMTSMTDSRWMWNGMLGQIVLDSFPLKLTSCVIHLESDLNDFHAPTIIQSLFIN